MLQTSSGGFFRGFAVRCASELLWGLPVRVMQGGGEGVGGGGGGGVKYRMLHIPGILDARITCMFPCLCAQGSSIAEYSLVAVKGDTCVLVCLYALRGFTRPSYISTW